MLGKLVTIQQILRSRNTSTPPWETRAAAPQLRRYVMTATNMYAKSKFIGGEVGPMSSQLQVQATPMRSKFKVRQSHYQPTTTGSSKFRKPSNPSSSYSNVGQFPSRANSKSCKLLKRLRLQHQESANAKLVQHHSQASPRPHNSKAKQIAAGSSH